jgi:integrase
MGKQHDGVRAISGSSIQIDFYYRGQRCRERIKLKPTPANLKRAANHRAAILLSIDDGTFDYAATFPDSKNAGKFSAAPTSGTVREYLEGWMESKAKTIKSSTAAGYRKAINGVLVPSLGNIPLVRLRRPDVRAMCEGMDAGNKRIGNVLSVLRTALDDALHDEFIEHNPVAGWSYKKNEPPKERDEVDPFTREEQARILDQLTGQGRNLIQFALWTGLRTSELCGLMWQDVDEERGELRVMRAVTQDSSQVETTKTVSGRRTVRLLGPAMAALNDQKQYTALLGAYIFHNPRTNEPWEGDGPIRKTLWQPALRKSKVRYRRPYQTRHTYASMMLSAGEHPMWVAQQMGHSDWGMIRRIYGKWMPDASPDAGAKAEAMFSVLGHDLGSIETKTRMNTG